MSDDADSADASDALAWETTDADVAYDCPGFDIVHEDVVLPDGTESDFDYLDESPSVVILPFTPRGDVVVIEEWRQAVKRVNRGLPAGGVESEDADFAAAAHRELTEETGYEAERVERLASFEPANGVSNAHHHFFVAYGCTPSGSQDLDFNESIRVEETTRDALRASLRRDDLRDGRTALALLYYETFGPEAETVRS